MTPSTELPTETAMDGEGIRFEGERLIRSADRATRVLILVAAFLAVLILLIRVLVHFPFLDETNHVRYLWYISKGFKPGPDFFCAYPVLYYFFILPFFKVLPESAYVLLVLRFLSVFLACFLGWILYRHGRDVTGDWVAAIAPLVLLAASGSIGPFLVEFSVDHAAALAAVGAMALFFRAPGFRNVGMAAALCLLSVFITPKYAWPLFFGLLGYVGSFWLRSRDALRTILAVAVGAAATGAVVLSLYGVHGISIVENLRTAVVLNYRLLVQREPLPGYSTVGMEVLKGCLANPLLGLILFLGLAGWIKRSWRRLDAITLAGSGILFGIIVYGTGTRIFFEQYQMPLFLSLAMFAPFAFTLFSDGPVPRIARTVFTAAAALWIALQFPAMGPEFTLTNVALRDTSKDYSAKGPPAVKILMSTEWLLSMIPPGERVLALWFHHPLFRRDLTLVTTDDRPSLSDFLADDDPLKEIFDPEYLRAELEANPPALIDLFQMDANYPPGWADALTDYLSRNGHLYRETTSPFTQDSTFYLRRDLLEIPAHMEAPQ